jgi:hypothetical protein
MAKMAGLHAALTEIDYCEWCGDPYEICEDAGECYGPSVRAE